MAYNSAIDEFRDDEYPMMKGKVYLDHGGTTICSRSLVEAFAEKMVSNLYGNPHSASDPAKLSGDTVDAIREQALRFFKADPEHFDMIFVANATAAIKLVAESFRDLALQSSVSGAFWYGYHKDAHTSLVGPRDYTEGNHHCFGSDKEVNEWLKGYSSKFKYPNDGSLPGLFAFPGQSNMTGRRLPLSWSATLRKSTKIHHQNTYSLLDAAALATTTQLDFSDPETSPDFTALSFYKIFGFPDLGALIVRKKSGHILSWRKYFGGGTVNSLTVFHESTVHRKDSTIHESLEDGTLPFHSIIALGCAFETHKKQYGSMKAISRHTSFLARRLYTRLSSLCHYNGRPAVVIYNDVADTEPYTDPTTQGATIAFNLVRADGTPIRHSLIEQMANDKKIYLRSGGLCNAGGIASHLKVEPWQFKRAWSAGHRCGEPGDLEIINGKPTGVVRASLGAMSTVQDVDIFIMFISDALIEHTNKEVRVPLKTELQALLPSRTEAFYDRSDASFDYNADDRVAPRPSQAPPSQFKMEVYSPTPSVAPPQRRKNPSHGSSADSRMADRLPPVPPAPPRTDVYPDRKEASFDFDAEGRVAPRPPHLQRQKMSETSETKPPQPVLRTQRSFFTRKSQEPARIPHSQSLAGVSEFSGSTLTTEDAELRELIKQNMVLGGEDKSGRGKGSLKFWKASKAI